MDSAQLWQSFAIECQSHLEAIESFLVEVEESCHGGASTYSGDVATVFRSYHSLKGISAAMGVQGVSLLAHVCEDILGLVRDGRAAIDYPSYQLLQSGHEELSKLIWVACEFQGDVPHPDALIESFQADYIRLSSSDHPSEAQDSSEDSSSEEDEMMMIYCEVARENLDTIYDGLFHGEEETWHEGLDEHLSLLADGATTIEMDMLSEDVQSLMTLIPDQRQAAQEFFSETLVEQYNLLFELADQPSWGKHDRQDAVAELHNLHAAMTDIIAQSVNIDVADDLQERVKESVSQALQLLGGVPELFDLLKMPDVEGCVARLIDILENINKGNFEATPDIFLLFTQLNHLIMHIELEETEEGLAQVTEDLTELDRLIEYILFQDLGSTEDGQGVDAYDIDESFLPILTADQIEEILALLDNDKPLFGIRIYPERDHKVANAFIEWFKAHNQVITNRTLFEGNETGFEFLFATDGDFSELEKQILGHDPELKILKSLMIYRPSSSVEEIDFREAKSKTTVMEVMKNRSDQLIRVPLSKLNTITDFTRTILTTSYAVEESVSELCDETTKTLSELANTINEMQAAKFSAQEQSLKNIHSLHHTINSQIHTIRNRLNDIVMNCTDMSMVPLEHLLNRLSRSARMVSENMGKKVGFRVVGDQVNVDSGLYEVLSESLTHLVRNAIDHGVETPEERVQNNKNEISSVVLSVLSRGEELFISLRDDGRGINRDRVVEKALRENIITPEKAKTIDDEDILKLIARGNFSTAEQITDVSGRGVGMEVVLKNVLAFGGEMHFTSELGKSTTFYIRMPLQSTIQNLLLFKVGKLTYALPSMFVQKLVQGSDLPEGEHGDYFFHSGRCVQVSDLRILLSEANGGFKDTERTKTNGIFVGLNRVDSVLLVDEIIGQQQIHVQQGNAFFSKLPYVQKATISGVKEIILILDTFKFISTSEDAEDSLHSSEIVHEE